MLGDPTKMPDGIGDPYSAMGDVEEDWDSGISGSAFLIKELMHLICTNNSCLEGLEASKIELHYF
jgi:hypothetical protein